MKTWIITELKIQLWAHCFFKINTSQIIRPKCEKQNHVTRASLPLFFPLSHTSFTICATCFASFFPLLIHYLIFSFPVPWPCEPVVYFMFVDTIFPAKFDGQHKVCVFKYHFMLCSTLLVLRIISHSMCSMLCP